MQFASETLVDNELLIERVTLLKGAADAGRHTSRPTINATMRFLESMGQRSCQSSRRRDSVCEMQ